MKIIAYIYSDPLLEKKPDIDIWGLEVDRIYEDLGQHQQLEILIQDCQIESPDYLLLRRLEELGNSMAEISDRLNQLEKLGIEIIAIEQDYHTSQFQPILSTDARQHFTQLLQEIQKSQRSQKLQQGHARNRLKALPPPGKAPYGYRRGKDRYILDRSTAPVVKDFFEQFLRFGSLRGAVRYLEKRYGKKISVSTGQRWLMNPVYRGDLAYQNQDIIADTHVAIISREEAAQIERLLRRNATMPARTASAPRSLAGLVFCQSCQSPQTITRVTRRNKNEEYLYLRPKNCPLEKKCSAIAYEEILRLTIEKICQELPPTVAQLNLPNLDFVKNNLIGKIQQKQGIIEQLPLLKEQGILDQETLELRTYTLKTEISKLRTQLDQLPPGDLKMIVKAVSLSQFWLDLSETERRFYFREFIKKIEIVRTESKHWGLNLVFVF